MNPFYNPNTAIPFIINYLSDPGRLKRFNSEKMSKYRDKVFRNTIRYGYTVPLYQKKYKEAGITPDKIKGINDVIKLPFVSKNDLIENYPDDIIPKGYDKKNAEVVCTSGSTGKPVSIYNDFQTMSRATGIFRRELDVYGLNWKKSKLVHMGNFSPDKADIAFEKGFMSKVKSFYSFDNYLPINAFDSIKENIKKLDDFKPDLIVSYPATYQHLAFFKKKGYGKNINPKILAVGGYVLDEYTRNYVEEAFGCRMLNVYGSAESAADMAFECFDGTWHINHDFYHIEAVDEKMNVVGPEEKGHIILTKMFGKGTPIIRYTGMDDWVSIVPEYECSCGLCTPIFKNGVEGRMSTSVILPDGRLFPSASFAILSVVLNKMKTRKVRQFQIVQKKIDEIDILLVFDEDLRDVGPSVDEIFKKTKEVYVKKVGPGVKINVKEVKEIKSKPGKPSPLVISHVKPEEGFKLTD